MGKCKTFLKLLPAPGDDLFHAQVSILFSSSHTEAAYMNASWTGKHAHTPAGLRTLFFLNPLQFKKPSDD